MHWVERMEFPKHPVEDGSGRSWVPVSFPMVCDWCSARFHVPVRKLPNKSNWTLYGDEASRYISGHNLPSVSGAINLHCITLVGLHHKRRSRVEKQIAHLKKSISPDRHPDDWSLHFREIWAFRPDDKEFTFQSKASKIDFAKEMARIIREARPELATLNYSGCIIASDDKRVRRREIKMQIQDLFAFSLLSSLQLLRSLELTPRWVFDNIQDTSERAKVEGWAEEVFLGLQYTRLFAWLSAGSTVLAPEFHKPGAHYLSEIADFVSYCAARDFEKAIKGERSEFPSSLLGRGFYQGVMQDGSVMSEWAHGLPVKKFFGVPRA